MMKITKYTIDLQKVLGNRAPSLKYLYEFEDGERCFYIHRFPSNFFRNKSLVKIRADNIVKNIGDLPFFVCHYEKKQIDYNIGFLNPGCHLKAALGKERLVECRSFNTYVNDDDRFINMRNIFEEFQNTDHMLLEQSEYKPDLIKFPYETLLEDSLEYEKISSLFQYHIFELNWQDVL